MMNKNSNPSKTTQQDDDAVFKVPFLPKPKSSKPTLPLEPKTSHSQLKNQRMDFNKLMMDVRRIQIANGLGTVPGLDDPLSTAFNSMQPLINNPYEIDSNQWIEGVGTITQRYQTYVKESKEFWEKREKELLEKSEELPKEVYKYQIYFKRGFRQPPGSIVINSKDPLPENPNQESLDDQFQIKLAYDLTKSMVLANDNNIAELFEKRLVLVKRKVPRDKIPPNIFVRCIRRDIGRERPHLEELMDMRSYLSEEEKMKMHRSAALYPDFWTYEMIEYTEDMYWGLRDMDYSIGCYRIPLAEGILIPPPCNYPERDPNFKIDRATCPLPLPDDETIRMLFADS